MLNNKLPISAVILTYNEERKIEDCLKSISDLVEDVFVVDSFSTDKTLEIAKKYTNNIFQHEFENYGKQRNWALKTLPINSKWVLNLNSDQRIEENLKIELIKRFASNDLYADGYLITRKTIFLNKWIKHGGHYPVYDAVLFKSGCGFCEESRYDQVFTINGKVDVMSGDIEDIVTDSLSNFIFRHNKWSTYEAIDQVLENDQISRKLGVKQNLFGNPMERRRYFKAIYMKLPLFVRPIIYFIYRFFLKFGFLDGKEGLIFHFLQGFWFRFLVDAKIYEITSYSAGKKVEIKKAIEDLYGIST